MALGDSATSICNIGLIAIGEDPVASISPPDNRKAAILCGARYDQIRRAMLRTIRPNFARRQAQLAASPTPPLFTFGAAYPVPPGFLAMYDLPENDQAVWEVIGNQILTDEGAPLNTVFVADVADATLFDSTFVEALGYGVAVELAMPLRQDKAVLAEMEKRLKDRVSAAQLLSSQENSPREWDVDVWLRHRR